MIAGESPEDYAGYWGNTSPNGVYFYNFGSEHVEKTPRWLHEFMGVIMRKMDEVENSPQDFKPQDAAELQQLYDHVYEMWCNVAFLDQSKHWQYGQVAGPWWKEECGHGGYVGTLEFTWNQRFYDVYAFEDGRGNQQVCMRFSDEPGDYLSVVSLLDLVRQSAGRDDEYKMVVLMLEDKGTFKWEAKS